MLREFSRILGAFSPQTIPRCIARLSQRDLTQLRVRFGVQTAPKSRFFPIFLHNTDDSSGKSSSRHCQSLLVLPEREVGCYTSSQSSSFLRFSCPGHQIHCFCDQFPKCLCLLFVNTATITCSKRKINIPLLRVFCMLWGLYGHGNLTT